MREGRGRAASVVVACLACSLISKAKDASSRGLARGQTGRFSLVDVVECCRAGLTSSAGSHVQQTLPSGTCSRVAVCATDEAIETSPVGQGPRNRSTCEEGVVTWANPHVRYEATSVARCTGSNIRVAIFGLAVRIASLGPIIA